MSLLLPSLQAQPFRQLNTLSYRPAAEGTSYCRSLRFSSEADIPPDSAQPKPPAEPDITGKPFTAWINRHARFVRSAMLGAVVALLSIPAISPVVEEWRWRSNLPEYTQMSCEQKISHLATLLRQSWTFPNSDIRRQHEENINDLAYSCIDSRSLRKSQPDRIFPRKYFDV